MLGSSGTLGTMRLMRMNLPEVRCFPILPTESEVVELIAKAWKELSVPLHDWESVADGDVDVAWEVWSADAQLALQTAGVLSGSGCPLGMHPPVVVAGASTRQGQSHAERRLRRVCRRLAEWRLLLQKGGDDTHLYARISCDVRDLGAPDWMLRDHSPASLLQWCENRLSDHLQYEQRQRLHRWELRMRHPGHCIRWLKRKAPLPWAIAGDANASDPLPAYGPAAGAARLAAWWSAFLAHAEEPSSQGEIAQVHGTIWRLHPDSCLC